MADTLQELREQAASVVNGLSPLAIRNMAFKHMKSDAWVRRYLRHCAYWMPGSLLYAAAKTGDLPATPTGARDENAICN